MTHLTLVLLVDAFRRDYVHRTRFIRDLATTSRTGALREDFGFVPRAAYFGGLSPGEAGFTNMYCYDPVRSPFGVARGLPQSKRGREVEEPLGIRAWLEDEARKRVPPFAGSYLSTAEIPLDLVPNFDLVEKRAPWDRRVGYRSVFHELDDEGTPYFCRAWPETNCLADRSDAGIANDTLAHVQPSCRFAFVHLQELDAIGHAYGPESGEILTAIEATDRTVERLVTGLGRRFDRLDLVLFGDHGMVPVTGTVDVWAALEAADLARGQEVVFFLDSTMARFWFRYGGARERVVRALDGLPGRVLGEKDLERLRLAGCDRRNAELIFLVEPGLVIAPNFFQRRGQIVRGMHGYEPDCPDNQGFFLVRDHAQSTAAELGPVGPTAVYHETRRLLGLASKNPALNGHRSRSRRLRGLLTQVPDPEAHTLVGGHMTRVVHETRQLVQDPDAILLTGSFGRDEGGVVRDAAGRLRPVNDYDVLVVAREAPEAQSAELRALGQKLANEFGTDFVHFSLWRRIEPSLPLTLANYDVRYGSHVLWGDPDVLAALPRFAAADIPIFEGVQLLFNRLAGVLTGLRAPDAQDVAPADRTYLVNQAMKGFMAVGDWHLLRSRAYDVSYQTRQERFAWLAPGFQLDRGLASAIRTAYAFKVRPDCARVDPANAADLASRARRWLIRTLVDAVGTATKRRTPAATDAAAAYYDATTADAAAVRTDNAFATSTLDTDSVVQVCPEPKGSVRQSIYASLPLVAAAADGDRTAFGAATRRLDGCLTGPWPSELTPANWEVVRSRLTHAWLTLVH